MWGREGVLIFSVKLPARLERTVLKNFGAGWSPCSFAPVPALVRACIDEPDAALREPAIFDLIALCSAPPGNPGPPPAWLIQAHDAIREEAESISIAGVAEAAGVHRVHLSSAFTQYFGIPPSLYRLQVLTARALGRIASGVTPLTQIAHEEGFSDQAHLSRSVRRATGTSPRRLRALLA
jgi:AraC family transcriptional regulator